MERARSSLKYTILFIFYLFLHQFCTAHAKNRSKPSRIDMPPTDDNYNPFQLPEVPVCYTNIYGLPSNHGEPPFTIIPNPISYTLMGALTLPGPGPTPTSQPEMSNATVTAPPIDPAQLVAELKHARERNTRWTALRDWLCR